MRARHGDRRGRRRLPAPARPGRDRHRVLRRVAGVSALPAGARRLRRPLRDVRRPRGAEARDRGGLPRRRVAALHRAPHAQRGVVRADQAEEGGGAGDSARGLRRAGPRPRARAVPSGLRGDRRHMPEGGRAARGCRGGRPGLPGLPLCAPQAHPHQQRPGAGQPRAQAPQPRGAGLPVQEIADQDAGRRVLRNGRGLGVEKVVHRGIHSFGRIFGEVGRTGAVLRRHRRRTRQAHHGSCGRRQPDRKESGVC